MSGSQSVGAKLGIALVAGLFTAVFEMIFVLPIQGAMGASPLIVFQSIAYGVVGKVAFAQGMQSALLGVFFHTLISVVAAGVYVFAADMWPVMRRHAIVSGLLFGVAVYVVMTFIIVPLSQVGFRLPKAPLMLLLSFSIHLVGFGLPIALVDKYMSDRTARSMTPQAAA